MTDDNPALPRAACALDPEQRARVRDCLNDEGLSLAKEQFELLIREVEDSIGDFLAEAPRGTFRDARDALRELWELSHDDDPPVAVLRARVKALPRVAIEYVDGRMPIVIEALFPDERQVTGFQKWAATADPDKLIRVTQVISAEGAQMAPGRSRGAGKRSAPRPEPMIMDEVRGAGAVRDRGGRPDNNLRLNLVLNLAMDWLAATGGPPRPGRSDKTGFGGLVHSVFQWLKLPEGAATHALRQHWES